MLSGEQDWIEGRVRPLFHLSESLQGEMKNMAGEMAKGQSSCQEREVQELERWEDSENSAPFWD